MDIIKNIRKDLINSADEKTKESFHRFFKEPVKAYGVKTAIVTKIAKTYWQEIKTLPKAEIYKLCEELFKSDYTEEAFIVSNWVPNLKDQFTQTDFKIFEGWIEKYVNNWAKCDGFCNHTIGDFIQKYPKFVDQLKVWAKSNNRWVKRAAAVSLIVPAKKGDFLKDAIDISDILLSDPDDMVQKGYGWLLKEESRKHIKEVHDYVIRNKTRMPRTALRYAIELMPEALKVSAMEK